MQKILGYMRKAVTKYSMIEDGDKIGVGLSGGKDSLVLLMGLARLKKFIGIDFEIVGLTLDLKFNNLKTDYSLVQKICDKYDIKYYIQETNIGQIVFDYRKEKNPCSLCARMRRGALHDFANEHGCNKIALGHNCDDWIETFFMNLFNEGRVGAFSPVSYLSIKNLHMIRPLILTPEKLIKNVILKYNIPVVKNSCPADGNSNREWTKQYLAQLETQIPNVKKKILSAVLKLYDEKL